VPMRIHQMLVLFSFLLVMLLLNSCGSTGMGTIPSGTPDHGNGTPAVIPTPSPSSQPVLTAPPTALGATYAFVRKKQLWVALNNTKPMQITHFDYTNLPDAFWHQPLWSPDDHFIAFIMNARPVGQGGGGCPAPDYGANGALYLLNTATMQLTQLVVFADSSDPVAKSALNGYWQYAFWEDPMHLLVWYNGIIGKTSNTAGLYRFDLSSQKLTQVMPLSALGVATLFNPQKNVPLLLSMRYSNGQLYYLVISRPFEQQSQFAIYHHSIVHPALPGSKVVDMGNEPWCNLQQSGPFIIPGWDVSPDGEQLVAQMVSATGTNQAVGSIQALDLKDGSTKTLFTQASAQMLMHDLTLTWGPDSKAVVATEDHLLSQDGPYGATLANPSAMQRYTPNLAGQIAWKADSSAFVLQNTDMADASDESSLYIFNMGDMHGQLLLTDARDFEWG
jgi:hypothetical protein